MNDPSAPAPSDVADEIEREVLRVHEDSYGTGASAVHVHLDGDFVLVILDVVLTPAERTLFDAGHMDTIKNTRESYQHAIAPTFTAIIERATGRKVASFLSAMSIEPLYSAELFRLEPAA
jgi:uncharacterized protein YbcI